MSHRSHCEPARMYFRVEPKDVSLCRDLLLGLKLHLQGLEEQYPQALQVTYLEV